MTQSAGMLLLAVGFAVGVASVPAAAHFTSAHGIIGLVLMVLAVLQASLPNR